MYKIITYILALLIIVFPYSISADFSADDIAAFRSKKLTYYFLPNSPISDLDKVDFTQFPKLVTENTFLKNLEFDDVIINTENIENYDNNNVVFLAINENSPQEKIILSPPNSITIPGKNRLNVDTLGDLWSAKLFEVFRDNFLLIPLQDPRFKTLKNGNTLIFGKLITESSIFVFYTTKHCVVVYSNGQVSFYDARGNLRSASLNLAEDSSPEYINLYGKPYLDSLEYVDKGNFVELRLTVRDAEALWGKVVKLEFPR